MKGKVIGTYNNIFKDGTVTGVICIQRTDVSNISGVVSQPFNVSLDSLPVKNLSDLVGKEVIVSDSGFPKYTWIKEVFVL